MHVGTLRPAPTTPERHLVASVLDRDDSVGESGPVSTAIVSEFEESDRSAVIDLWHACGLVRPWNDPSLDIDRNLAGRDARFFIAVSDRAVVGSVMAGYDGHRGWINYLGVDLDHRRRGVGAQLMEHAERYLGSIGCPKINVQIRSENAQAIAFYERLGFAVEDVVSMGKRLDDDSGPDP